MQNLSVPRPLSFLHLPKSSSLLLLLLLSIPYAFDNQALGQRFNGLDVSINAFGQFTGSSSGNGIVDKPSRSLGGLVSVRQSFKPWLGYEVNWSYTRFSEAYSTYPFAVQNNLHEFTGAYLVQAPRLLGFQPFAALGTGFLIFLPTTTGGQKQSLQTRTPLLYELGVNYPIVTSHFGARFEYRGFLYNTPDFKETIFKTNTRRQTGEPTVGLYLRF